MKQTAVLGMLAFVAAFSGAMALRTVDSGQLPWLISRASGLVAFALLSLSVIFGLLVSSKAADGFLSRVLNFELHQFLSVLTLSLIAIHGGSLLFDGFLTFTPASVLLPFASPYEPIWTGLGVIAGWGAAAVTASFWMRKQIGQKGWRRFHYASFGVYVLSLVHGVMAGGADSRLSVVWWLYMGSAAAVAALLTYRIAAPRQVPAGARRAAARRVAGEDALVLADR